ncbi:substrate-binding domain-containing protein [Nitratireductor sp. GCM10026969]|uniref:substrate-binding domain-containing protein n=1 Tax=Nitratireductor sp. GCM10026969 TaxID=3252645 RepID=UPI00360CF706
MNSTRHSWNGRSFTKLAAASVLTLGMATGVSAQTLPLTPLDDDDERDFWWYHQVQDDAVLEAMQEVVAGPAERTTAEPDGPISIAVIYPSQDVSDFWLRAYLAMEARFEELGIETDSTQFASGMGDHQLQATYTEQVMQEDYDYVIFGPTELSLQQENIKDLIDAGQKVIVLNYDTVVQAWGDDQPMMYATFSHLAGALNMCEWVLENLGTEGTFAMIRGTPGSLDDQRSGGFANCLAENSDWQMAYEHYGNFLREGGFDGAQQILSAYPEVTLLHNANTAMAMGAVSAVQASGAGDRVKVTAWGGTGDELEALRLGELAATPMRMGDDVGIAMAEAIRADLEGRTDDIPLVFLGRITIVSADSGADTIDAMEEEAFRYTGTGTLER